MSAGASKIPVVVTEVAPVNDLVTRFTFKRRDGGEMPTFSGGSTMRMVMMLCLRERD